VQKSTGKFPVSNVLNQDGILFIDYLPKGQPINAQFYSSLLEQLKDILKKKKSQEFRQDNLVLVRQCPISPGACNPEETGLNGRPFF